jgi:hypothetical protein
VTWNGVTGPYQGTMHFSYEIGASAQMSFTGRQIQLAYLASPDAGQVDVYIDGVKVTTIDQTSAGWEWEKSWTSELLSAGDHSLRLVYASGANSSSFASIDRITVIP